MKASPISDPLAFWAGALIRLGAVLAIVGVAPAAIDFLFFNGAAVVMAAIALYTLLPLAALCLFIGGVLWIIDKLKP